MPDKPSLIYFELDPRNKGLALVAKMCRAVNCECALHHITPAGLLSSSKTHRKGEEHPGILTPNDLRAVADFVEAWQKEVQQGQRGCDRMGSEIEGRRDAA